MGAGGGLGEAGSYRSYTHTVCEIVCVCVAGGVHAGHLTLTYRQPANGSAPDAFCPMLPKEVTFFYYLKFDTIDFGHLNKRDAQQRINPGGGGAVLGEGHFLSSLGTKI